MADRVLRSAVIPHWDTTIGAVVGSDGVLVVDTRATHAHGAEIRDHVRRLAPDKPVRWVVNTHEHFDHVLGNLAFEDARIHAHENAAARMVDACRADQGARSAPTRRSTRRCPGITAEVLEAVLATDYRLPDATFSSAATIDLGDRYVELRLPGRGHTAGRHRRSGCRMPTWCSPAT